MKKNVWHTLESHPELRFGQYVVPNFVSNSVALKVDDNEFVVVSPGKSLLENWPAEWQNENVKLHIIMPNGFHYMGVEAWQAAFPRHTLYASCHAIGRLVEKGVANKASGIVALEDHQPPLPKGYSVLFPPGHRAGDVWLKKEREFGLTTWITCDSFLNYERMSNQPIAKAMQRLLGAAPGLKISQVVKWYIIEDKKAFKHWALDLLETETLYTLIPSHGEIAEREGLGDEIKALLKSRL
ncbi:hypothetical protein [Litoribacillus peritrichatus]|uniref:DUF4336 domain-containing protein n=1 Tax=Litoribacillus peritrichatus TaxID=718191 RepID=A0ABP7M9M0_9GAMM